ncbi:MAG: putative toxin-antitoxin system toxin component, PIN family [Synergistaceae bacterium]|nr:putative toxin-antitoxin system toxin component, PIN family [Synergistaceae bacterium]
MKIFIDTNVLISAALFPNSKPALALEKAKSQICVICLQNLNEMIKTFYRKFPDRLLLLENFLSKKLADFQIVPIALEINALEKEIRDVKDRPLLRTAIDVGAEYFLTGDKDFLESGVQIPKIISVSDFLELELK